MPTGQANWIEQISVVRSTGKPVGAGEAISEGLPITNRSSAG
jgi:hypothetical protein